jgi:predicted membrane-bound spermidine synthase/tetratricopeptide (TPR) repeat protein
MKRSPIVYFLFFCSGITALVYEIVWTRMLTLTFGHTVFSVSVVLSAFMAGLGFGSYLFGVAIDRLSTGDQGGEAPASLAVYGWIEILIFASAALLSLMLANFSILYAWLHTWLPESAALQNTVKAVLAFGLIFIPTTLMGATLPIISKYYVTDNTKLGTQVGLLYAINTLGAAVGCLLTGFILISMAGVLETVLLAAGANLFIGISAIRIYQDSGGRDCKFRLPPLSLPRLDFGGEDRLWMTISFIAGLSALSYEVLWTRLLVFSISSTVYSFSMMLAVFLLGIFLGSLLVAPLAAWRVNLRAALVFLQAGTGLYVIGSIYNMEKILSPPWNSYNLENPAAAFLRYFIDSASLMLVPTLLTGMCFPVLIKLISRGHEGVGRGTGQIYAANTLGAILGSLITGFFILPWLGSQNSLVLVASLNLLTAAFVFASGPAPGARTRRVIGAAAAGLVLFVAFAMPGNLLDQFFMRDSAGQRSPDRLLYFEEGLTDTVAVFKDEYGPLDPDAKRLITNGISMSASNMIATRYMKLFAHVPILLVDQPDDVLVVCFGTGQTTGAAALHPTVKTVDSLELSASVIRAGTVFADQNHDALNNPKVRFVIQDGRNHLLTTRKKYDVITAEPPPPRTAFTVNLYTKEYYEMAKNRLRSGGIVAQWIPLHSQGSREVAMHFRTFISVFPHAIAWMSVANEILVIGSNKPIELDIQRLRQRLEDPVVKKALADIEIPDATAFLSNLWFFEEQMIALGAGAPIISDNRPRIEFYLDLGKTIGIAGRETLVFNRASFSQVAGRIARLTHGDRDKLQRYYEMMDLYQRGVMYSNRGQLLKAMSLVEDDDLIRYHLQAGRDQIARLEELLAKDPDDVETLLNLGHVHYQLGQHEKSIGYLQRVLDRKPGQNFANLYMGYDLLELGRQNEAKPYFNTAAKSDPRQLGTVMQEIGLIELLNKYEANPKDLGLINSLAQFYNIKNQFLKALEYSLPAQELDPMNLPLLKSIIYSYRGLGEPNEVLIYGTRYELTDPNDINLQFLMGEAYAATLRCEKARPYLEKVLAQDDSFRNAQKLLDQCQPPAQA